jgi:hypothetical protein
MVVQVVVLMEQEQQVKVMLEELQTVHLPVQEAVEQELLAETILMAGHMVLAPLEVLVYLT